MRMNVISSILTLILIAGPALSSQDKSREYSTAFARTFEEMKTSDAQSLSRSGGDDIKVRCTVLPKGRVNAIAWEIDNPKGKRLDVSQKDIRVSNQVREVTRLEPANAAQKLYGALSNKASRDPFVNATAPSEYLQPEVISVPWGINDLYSSAFFFGPTSATKSSGFTYYTRYGSGEKLTAEIKLNGETFKFEFK